MIVSPPFPKVIKLILLIFDHYFKQLPLEKYWIQFVHREEKGTVCFPFCPSPEWLMSFGEGGTHVTQAATPELYDLGCKGTRYGWAQKIQPTLFSSLVQMSVIIWWTSHHPIKSYNYIVLNIYYVPVPLLTAPAALLHCILTPAL